MDNELPTQLPSTIPLSTAAKIAERSPKTIRRWVHRGELTDKRADGDTQSPLLIDTHELLAKLSTQTPRVDSPVQLQVPPDVHQVDTTTQLIANLGRQVEGLELDKARLLSEVKRLRDELGNLRTQLDESRSARAVIERELSGGVRGLLRGAVRRLRR
jgi:septal ring factor EnvC (AmiA/AmiB activator)